MEALKDYQKMEQIQGREYDMSPASIKHIAIQRNLSAIIWNFLRGKRCKLFTEAEVVFDDENIFIPDLLVVCDQNQIKKNCIDGAPDFVVEVLSPSTKRRDVTIKKESSELSLDINQNMQYAIGNSTRRLHHGHTRSNRPPHPPALPGK